MREANKLKSLLGLKKEPVALAFLDEPPGNISRIPKAGPSGCAYWKSAEEGSIFYTEAEDHYNCPIGSYTHNVPLPPGKEQELMEMVGMMGKLGYIKQEEVEKIPRLQNSFKVAVYAPLHSAPFKPDVVLIRCNPKQTMLLWETLQAAGMGGDTALMGRPTCAMIPGTLHTGHGAASVGCIGNRVYTGLGDDELYVSLPGKHLNIILEKLSTIVSANNELAAFHRDRKV